MFGKVIAELHNAGLAGLYNKKRKSRGHSILLYSFYIINRLQI